MLKPRVTYKTLYLLYYDMLAVYCKCKTCVYGFVMPTVSRSLQMISVGLRKFVRIRFRPQVPNNCVWWVRVCNKSETSVIHHKNPISICIHPYSWRWSCTKHRATGCRNSALNDAKLGASQVLAGPFILYIASRVISLLNYKRWPDKRTFVSSSRVEFCCSPATETVK